MGRDFEGSTMRWYATVFLGFYTLDRTVGILWYYASHEANPQSLVHHIMKL